MRRTSPDLWMFIGLIVALVVLPFITGMLAVKLFRKFQPIQIEESVSVLNFQQKHHDGFFTMILVGWVFCGPLFYWIYAVYLN